MVTPHGRTVVFIFAVLALLLRTLKGAKKFEDLEEMINEAIKEAAKRNEARANGRPYRPSPPVSRSRSRSPAKKTSKTPTSPSASSPGMSQAGSGPSAGQQTALTDEISRFQYGKQSRKEAQADLMQAGASSGLLTAGGDFHPWHT